MANFELPTIQAGTNGIACAICLGCIACLGCMNCTVEYPAGTATQWQWVAIVGAGAFVPVP
jgi:hypothetical protein